MSLKRSEIEQQQQPQQQQEYQTWEENGVHWSMTMEHYHTGIMQLSLGYCSKLNLTQWVALYMTHCKPLCIGEWIEGCYGEPFVKISKPVILNEFI